ncbi:MAG TPA: magnesium transporter [Xanthomonadaceae bacterium]|nr:magnesium transporter [Xanthomonadaceae bacterium]
MSDTPDLLERVRGLDPRSAAEALEEIEDARIAQLLARLHIGHAVEVLDEFEPERRARIAAATPFDQGQLWLQRHSYPEGTVGRLMEKPPAVFLPGTTIAEVIEGLREIVRQRLVTYVFVTEPDGHLVGVVAFRELLFAEPGQTLAGIMLRDPFALRPEAPLMKAMQEVVTRHYPVYPVCDPAGKLLGIVRGHVLFEQQAFEISAQAGAMVGVEREERLATPWSRSLKFRHPWLQLNLLTVFAAAAVVGAFQDTIDRFVVLAMFLPVLAGQSGNCGSQTLAVTLRGMTLGELRGASRRGLVAKEAWLGLLNGLITGAVAGAAMYFVVVGNDPANALTLAIAVLVAMSVSCVMSGVSGTLIPLGLKRLGADPATASSIFLTTATDVVSMACLLGLATVLTV